AVDLRCGVYDEGEAQAAAAALARVDAIYTFGEKNVKSLRRAHRVPVIAIVNDAVDEGLAKDYRRPEGNVTGLCSRHPSLPSKLMEHYRQALPRARRMAFIAEGKPGSAMRGWMKAFEKAAVDAKFDVIVRITPLERFE